jgi:hypothetical protein
MNCPYGFRFAPPAAKEKLLKKFLFKISSKRFIAVSGDHDGGPYGFLSYPGGATPPLRFRVRAPYVKQFMNMFHPENPLPISFL